MSELITLVQPNAVTNARYEYSQIEKDIMYYIIEALQGYMSKEITLHQDIFGGIGIDLDMRNIAKSKNHAKVIQHIKGLMKKPISYMYNRDKRVYDITTVLVSGVIQEKNRGKITLKVPQEAVPVLVNIATGFTAYNKNVALTLPSVYAKRMYELCCRWKDKGFIRISLDEFRKMFCIEDKHTKISDLRESVLDMAQTMLSEYADLTYRYELRKENNSRAFNWLYIWISGNNQDPKDKASQKAYETVFNFLYELFRNSKAMEIADIIAENKELKRAAERFTRLKKDIRSGRIKVHGREQYIRRVIQDEFNIPIEVLGESPKKRKQKEAAEAAIKKVEKRKIQEARAKVTAVNKAKQKIARAVVSDLFATPETGKKEGAKRLGDVLRQE